MSVPTLDPPVEATAAVESLDHGEPAPPPAPGAPGHAGPPAVLLFAFWAFVIGGFAFGGIFVANWRQIMQRPDVTVDVPLAGQVPIGNLPALPVTAPLALPKVVGEIAAKPGRSGSSSTSDGPASPPASAPPAITALLPEWKGTDRINVLLLGIDRRDGEPMDGTRSDTIMLVSIDPVSKSAAMVSIPRDLWVGIPGYGPQRVNVAHALGGPELAKRTIAADFGFPVQYYARVDFRGFEELVNVLGGVLVDVDRPVKDDEYPTENYGYQRLYIAPGPQLLDGTHALYYARSRHSENDFGRSRRQQKVLVAMRDRALQLNMLPRAPALIGTIQKALSTDLSGTDLLALARLASEIDREKIATVVIDTNYATPFKGADGADLLQPNIPAIRAAIDRALKANVETVAAMQAKIEVLNGAGRAGLGQVAADQLTKAGLTVDRIGLAERANIRETQVVLLKGNRQTADAVAKALNVPLQSVVVQPSPNSMTDVRVILGQDYATAAAR